MPNAATLVQRALYQGVTGSPLEECYLSLVLTLLATINNDTADPNPVVNVNAQIAALVGEGNPAARDIAQRLNSLQNKFSRGQ